MYVDSSLKSLVMLQARTGASQHMRRANPGEAGGGSQGHSRLRCACPGLDLTRIPTAELSVDGEGRVGK